MRKTPRRDKKLQAAVDPYKAKGMTSNEAVPFANGDMLRAKAQIENNRQIRKFANQHKNKD